MAEDKEREQGRERPSRPVTAAARRERRGGARPANKNTGVAGLKGSDEDVADTKAGSRPSAKAGARAAGKSARAEDGKGAVKASGKPAAKTESAGASSVKGKATPVRDRKPDRPSLFARLVRFIREVVAELRKVIWPSRKQMVTYTAVVLVFLAFMVALVAGVDVGLAKVVFLVFGN